MLRQRQQSSPINLSRTLNSNRQHPFHASQSTSMESVNLNSRLSSSAPSLNNANSPAIMLESFSLHRQAASLLNKQAINAQQKNTMLQRLKPNSDRLNSIAKFIKNSAIGAAGVGGVVSISSTLSRNSERGQIENLVNEAMNTTTTTTTTTATPEITNKLGVDK